MLLDAGLNGRFWAEAVCTAVYLHRRTPTNSLPSSKSPLRYFMEVGHRCITSDVLAAQFIDISQKSREWESSQNVPAPV